jgi:hypothetical protein
VQQLVEVGVEDMLTLRKEQMKVFQPIAVKSFEDRVVAHLQKVFPEKSAQLGEDKLRDAIKYETQRAAVYSITSERDACKYIDLSILYGPDFDKDSNLPWAQNILQNKNIRNPSTKVDRLIREAKKHKPGAA